MLKRICTITAVTLAVVVGGAAIASADSYTVEPGDTLSGIADSYSMSWQDLYASNRDAVGANPDLIFPGQVLTVGGKPSGKPQATMSSVSHSTDSTVMPATGHVTSPYGMRTHPTTGVYKLHTGTDYSAGDGVARAAASGEVTGVEWHTAYGNLVTISHGGSTSTRYAHLAGVSVSVGQSVGAGDKVGDIGSTGYSTGPHLHFEVLVDSEFVDPASWLD
jgi:murein DD-endopeptidase MepM/ murein hydrolase activator NlpD